MSSFGDFDPEALKQMYEAELDFAETHNDLEVSPQRNQSGYPTMSFDFAKCQRRDGTVYGIPSGSECQSGKKVSDKQTAEAIAPVPSRPIRDPIPGVLKRQEEHRQFMREESRRLLQMYPGLKKAELKKKLEKSIAQAMTPAQIEQGLKDAAAEMVRRDRANPGPLRSRTPITPTREMMGFPPIKRA